MKTFTHYAEKKAKQFFNLLQNYTKSIRITAILMLLVVGTSNAWGYIAHFSLIGEPINSWSVDRDFMINTGTGTTDEWYIYAYVANGQYFALHNGSNQYGPSSNGKAIKQGTGGGQGAYNINSWQFTGTSGIIKICCAESNNREWDPWVWVDESAPTINFKHPWNNGNWDEKTATKQDDGTYTYDGKYGNRKAFNAGPSGKYKYNESQTTVEGSPATGDMCRFIWNPVGYVQGGAETKASGTFKIVKLCSLTYNGNGNTGGTVPSATNNELYNTSITLSSTTLSRNGYTHTGWNTKADGTGTHYDKGATLTLTTASLTLYAEWEKIETKYIITITSDGNGTVNPSSVEASKSNASTKFTATANDGYRFVNWTATDGITLADANSATTTVTATAEGTVTAHFELKTKVRLYFSNPNGWSKVYAYLWDHDGSDTNGNWPGIEITSNTVEDECNKYYYYEYYKEDYPNWDRIVFNQGNDQGKTSDITFSNTDNNGQYYINNAWEDAPTPRWIFKGSIDNWAVEHSLTCTNLTSGSVDFTLDANTKYEFKFVDKHTNTWYGVSTVTQITYTNKGTAQTMNNTDGGSANQTILTAGAGTYTFTWDITNKKVTVTYPTSYTVTYSQQPTAAADAPTTNPSITSGYYVLANTGVTFTAKDANNGYTWKGWYDNNAGTGTAHSANKEYEKSITANTTIYAVYTVNTYSITYNLNGGSGTMTPTEYQVTTATFNLPTTPTRTGYTFAGWYDNEELTGDAVTQIAQGSYGDKKYWAKWTPDTYTITYILDGGTGVENGTYTIESEDITLPTPTKENFIFGGWYEENTFNSEAVTTIQKGSTGNKKFYAKWGKNFISPRIYFNNTDTKWETAMLLVGRANYSTGYNQNVNPIPNTKLVYFYPEVTWTDQTRFTVGNAKDWGGSTESWETRVGYFAGNVIGTLSDYNFEPDSTYYVTGSVSNTINVDAYKYNGATDYPSLPFYTAAQAAKVRDTKDDNYAVVVGEWPASLSLEGTNMSSTRGWENTERNTITGSASTDGAVHREYTAVVTGLITHTYSNLSNDYQFEGWGTADAPTTTDDSCKYNIAANTTVYAFFTRIYRTTVILSHEGATTAGTTSVIATYDADMPTDGITMPVREGYTFRGYFDGENGTGKQYYNEDGTSTRTWDKKDDAVTLYAYFQKAEITAITLNAENFDLGAGPVIASATVAPTPAGTTIICWQLLYSSNDPVPNHDVQNGYQAQFSLDGLAAGTYKIKATLRTGNDCNSGTELSTLEKIFTIASNYTITVKYICDGREIQAPTTAPAKATEAMSITAPDIVGYTFTEWVAGDGVTISSTSNSGKTISYTAIYDGYLTAQYTKNTNIIYFYNTFDWENVYIYYYSGEYWGSGENDGKGTGAESGGAYQGYAQMTQIEGTNIWYVDANGKSTNYLVFGEDNQDGYQFFHKTNVCRRGDYNSKMPMFVPVKGQTPEVKNNSTNYYNKGYWMNYPEFPGYTLDLFNHWEHNDPARYIIYPYGENTIFPLKIQVEINNENVVDDEHKMWFRIHRNDGRNLGNGSAVNFNSQETYIADENSNNKIEFRPNVAGVYTFILDYKDKGNNDYAYHIKVEYPAEIGDYRVIYKDKATWSQGTAHDANWCHPSYPIKKNKSTTDTKTDIVSFFISYNDSPYLQFQKCTDATTSNVTWTNIENGEITVPNNITKAGVYNFIVEQPAEGESIKFIEAEPYTGNYYIRTDPIGSGWNDYQINPENRMTYSAFSESDLNKFGEKYSHYATEYCNENTNIKFVIANDYSPCISDTLAQDMSSTGTAITRYTDANGTLYSDATNSANVRFMWHHKTNKITRAYLGAAGDEVADRQFLILKANKEIKDSDGGSLENAGDNHSENQAIFQDTQNWIYERTIQVQPGTRVKLYACYPDTKVANAQFFCGKYDSNNTFDEDNSIQILGGTEGWYTIRVIYDFKTNRLLTAWMPSGDIDGDLQITADVMILREHQKDAQCITLANENSKLSNVKTVFGALRFNRWILNNRGGADLTDKSTSADNANNYSDSITNQYHSVLPQAEQKSIYERALYFISFPFDVHLSDVFGFGQYGTHWVISDYNGLRRAKYGHFDGGGCFNEDCTNWDYIWEPDTFVMKANVGYLLSLDLELMKYDDVNFWKHNISTVELYFPSTVELDTIQRTTYTTPALGDEYLCTIDRSYGGAYPDGDRRVKDSYWRCIGVPSFANYNGSLTDEENGDDIVWKTDYTWTADKSGFPFLYKWNTTDNSLMVQSTTNYNFRSTFAYLVQNKDGIYWSVVNTKPSSIIARQQTANQGEYTWKIALTRNDEVEDQTFMRMTNHEEVTADFDFGQDLSKEFNYGRSDIYSLIGYERTAANSMPCSDKTTIVPLGLAIETTDTYTIAMPEGMENIGVNLIDNQTGVHTNLSAGMEYTITLNAGTYENRFYIEISPIQNAPTDLEYTNESTRQESTRKVLIDEVLYIIRDGIIFDAQGHQL